MKKKIIYGIIGATLLGILGVWTFVFYLPSSTFYKNYKRNQAYKQTVLVTASELVKAFQENEEAAYKKFTGKNKKTGNPIVLEITGVVREEKMEEGHSTITLKSDDDFSNVTCVLMEDSGEIKPGSTVTIKGLCTGFLSDVNIIEAVITKK